MFVMSRDNLHTVIQGMIAGKRLPGSGPTFQATGMVNSHDHCIAGRVLSRDSPRLPGTSSNVKFCVMRQKVRLGSTAKMRAKEPMEILLKIKS